MYERRQFECAKGENRVANDSFWLAIRLGHASQVASHLGVAGTDSLAAVAWPKGNSWGVKKSVRIWG
jgi:hypothetical protein